MNGELLCAEFECFIDPFGKERFLAPHSVRGAGPRLRPFPVGKAHDEDPDQGRQETRTKR